MSKAPIFVITHPRSCSTAFERVFMTRADLRCIHEPFGDAFYYGPERLSPRFANDERARVDSGFSGSTYQTVLDRLSHEARQLFAHTSLANAALGAIARSPQQLSFCSLVRSAYGKQGQHLFIKDMAYYVMPPQGTPQSTAASASETRSVASTHPLANGENKRSISLNPTVLPDSIIQQFQFAFLIRHPRYAIPSYFRCTVPPLSHVTGFHDFLPSEAGYRELRRFFEYLRAVNGSADVRESKSESETSIQSGQSGKNKMPELCVIDADDLLDDPEGIVRAFCDRFGLEYDASMLKWDTKEDFAMVTSAFEKWKGFHEDAIHSTGLKPREHERGTKSKLDEDAEWTQRFGANGAREIRKTVDANEEDYEYLKKYALKTVAE